LLQFICGLCQPGQSCYGWKESPSDDHLPSDCLRGSACFGDPGYPDCDESTLGTVMQGECARPPGRADSGLCSCSCSLDGERVANMDCALDNRSCARLVPLRPGPCIAMVAITGTWRCDRGRED